MKKLILTTAIVLTMGLGAFAQGGLLGKGATSDDYLPGDGNRLTTPSLPSGWGSSEDQDGPLGSGIAVLLGLGAAYMVAKKRKD